MRTGTVSNSLTRSAVAMESTGVYWIPIFEILEDRGFEVVLVNSRHVKNVPGRKTPVHLTMKQTIDHSDWFCLSPD